jgi:hypothetical protein
MTYPAYEGSVEDGGPIQLYRFVYGAEAGEYLAYTNSTSEQTVDHGGSVGVIVYSPIPIQRGNIVSNGTLDKSAIRISLDVGTDLAELFRVYPPSSVVQLIIYEGHIDDPDDQFVVIWAGRVISTSREGSELNLSGEPISTQLRRPGLRRHYQYGCPHALYSDACGADKGAATVTATVSAIDGTVITLTAGWEGAFSPLKFQRGTLEWTPAGASAIRRTIIRVSGDDLSLSGLPVDLAVSDTVDVVLGCNHQAFTANGGDCETLHDRLVSFGGQPWIPTKNVINKNPYY